MSFHKEAAANSNNQPTVAFSTSPSDLSVGRVIKLPFEKIPIPASAAYETTQLFERLLKPPSTDSSKSSKVKVRHSEFELTHSNIRVHGWRYNDWDYKKGCLPTSARGLFSVTNTSNGEQRMEIVARGYDKFYNIEECAETKWTWIESNTYGPYYLTRKENGCIILLSCLPDGNLLVCSKHSAGSRLDTVLSHAQVGEKWVETHLEKVGLSKRDLAATLRSLNATAVAELCDDTFEEHIIEYESDKAGLYLHGLNLNTPTFHTYPFEAVVKFAENFGLRPVEYTKMGDVGSLRKFLENCAETGSWEGTDIEGFVVRCQTSSPVNTGTSDFFFKYKFEEPYLLYRGWREVTKQLLAGKPIRLKKHKKATREYLLFAKQYFQGRQDLAEQYQKNHGIIALRNAFLTQYGKDGHDIIKDEGAESDTETVLDNGELEMSSAQMSSSRIVGHSPQNSDYKYVIVPVATIGCGKTTLSLALADLLRWGHVQNDNISSKKGGTGRRFCELIRDTLMHRAVSIADRNNHMRREREQIFRDMNELLPMERLRFVALHFRHDGLEGKRRVQDVTVARVMARGDNHQSIHASTESMGKIQGIMGGFLNRFEPVNMSESPDNMFDLVIDLEVDQTLQENLKYILRKFVDKYPGIISELPVDQSIHDALQRAVEYVPNVVKSFNSSKSKSSPKAKVAKPTASVPKQKVQSTLKTTSRAANYFALKIDRPKDFLETVEHTLRSNGADLSFFEQLRSSSRIQQEFHVTLVHFNECTASMATWDFYYERMLAGKLGDIFGDVTLESICWDTRVMCVTAAVQVRSGTNLEKVPIIPKNFHITIGTADASIKPFESTILLEKFARGDSGVNCCKYLEAVRIKGINVSALK
ncbi:RNA ligase-domain-containing protein [Lipomyces arxii]|uniref:RNA ligase-domain-containing protein n=1 Tax=Lipomyces arxii TaxID=56418 RepID=UPI0034CFCD04